MEDYIQQVIQRNVPFEDTDFPKFDEINGISNFQWRRATNEFEGARMRGRDQIIQGHIPDCYLITALTVLSSRPDLLNNLILTKEINGCGVYGFQFFHSYDNEWKKIIIDDYIPFQSQRKPLFARFNIHKNILWPMLLEKAYAKLYGGYENISGGNVSETLLDLTGSPVEDYVLTKNPVKCPQIKKWLTSGFLVACAKVTPNPRYDDNVEGGNRSIIKNHAYSIEKVLSKGKKMYILLKNPLGGNNYSFSKLVGSKIGRSEPQGKIWMPYEQFMKEFNRVYCCKTNSQNNDMKEVSFHRQVTWTGSPSRIWRNPIFRITNNSDKNTRIVVTISQKSKRHEKVMQHKLTYDMIGFSVVTPSDEKVGRGIPNTLCLTYGDYQTIHKTALWNKRDVSSGFVVKKGSTNYIIPINHNEDSSRIKSTFSIRMDTKTPQNLEIQKMIPFTLPPKEQQQQEQQQEQEEEEETEGEEDNKNKGVYERIILKKKFTSKCGKIGDSIAQNPKCYIYVLQKCTFYVYLCQATKPYAGVGIFVLENTVKTGSSSTGDVIAQKGFTNPNDLGLEVRVDRPCVLTVVFVPFKKQTTTKNKNIFVEMSIVGDWSKIESYPSKEELMEKRGDEVKKYINKRSTNTNTNTQRGTKINKTRRRTTRGTTRGRTRGRATITTTTTGGRRRTRGRGRRGVGGLGGAAGMMANLYADLE